MGGKAPKTREQEFSEFSENINLAFISPVTSHSRALQVIIPKRDVEFYDIQPGDVVHVIVDRHKGERRVS